MGLRRWNKVTEAWDQFGTPQLDPSSIGAAASLHAAQHIIGGVDAISPGAIGAISSANGSVSVASTNSGVVRNIFASTSAPSGGIDGDVWLKYI
jgi:hypothetical protein